MEHVRNIDKQNFDELTVAFIGKVLTGKIGRRIVRLSSNSSDISTVKILRYTVHFPKPRPLLNGPINIFTLKFHIIVVSLLAFERL